MDDCQAANKKSPSPEVMKEDHLTQCILDDKVYEFVTCDVGVPDNLK